MECSLNDGLEMPSLFGASQLGEQVCSCVALPRYVVHLKAFKVINESFNGVVVLEQYCFLSLISVGNLPLDKLGVSVTS